MFEIPRRGRQARHFTTNVAKILDLKSFSEQIFSKNCRWDCPWFFLLFSHKKEYSRGEEFQSIAASRVPGREDVLQRYYENSASLLEKLRNKIFIFAISEHLLFKCYVH